MMRCHYCGNRLLLGCPAKEHQVSVDHLTPRSRGGSDGASNIVKACARCNNFKANMTEDEFWFFLETGTLAQSFIEYLEKQKRDSVTDWNQFRRMVLNHRVGLRSVNTAGVQC